MSMTPLDLYIDGLSVDLTASRAECTALQASNATLREMLHASLDQLHASNATNAKLCATLGDARDELRRLRPIVRWVEDERRDRDVAA
jgi:hypothetical protein